MCVCVCAGAGVCACACAGAGVDAGAGEGEGERAGDSKGGGVGAGDGAHVGTGADAGVGAGAGAGGGCGSPVAVRECVDALPLACEMEMVTFKENNVTHTIMLRIVARVGTHTAFCGSALAGRKKIRFCPVCSKPPHMSGWAHGAACVGKGAGGVGEGVGKGAGASVGTGTGAYEGGAHPCV